MLAVVCGWRDARTQKGGDARLSFLKIDVLYSKACSGCFIAFLVQLTYLLFILAVIAEDATMNTIVIEEL